MAIEVADYGTDLYLDARRDVEFTPDGDIRLQQGSALVAQDIREELYITLGSLAWDSEAGCNLIHQLNSELDIGPTVCAELERVALNDGRIDAATVEAWRMEDGRFRLVFSVLGYPGNTSLYFDLTELLEVDNG